MKEYPDPDYVLQLWELATEEQPSVAQFLDGGWRLSVNHCICVNVIAYLPTISWPPAPAMDLDLAADADEAARVVFSKSVFLIAPTNGSERLEELTGDIPERQTIFWFTRTRYAALDAEFHSLYQRLSHGNIDSQLRLSDLDDGALRTFLDRDLPRSAALSDYEREMLCLGPLQRRAP